MTLFYVGYRELFERPGRDGYTRLLSEAGKFTEDAARNMTKYPCADGYVRWMIPCDTLDNFDGHSLTPKEMY